MRTEKFICIKDHKCVGEIQAGIDKTCYKGSIYFLEEVPLDNEPHTASFWHVESETNYIGIIFSIDNFISVAEWRDKQIDSILD